MRHDISHAVSLAPSITPSGGEKGGLHYHHSEKGTWKRLDQSPRIYWYLMSSELHIGVGE